MACGKNNPFVIDWFFQLQISIILCDSPCVVYFTRDFPVIFPCFFFKMYPSMFLWFSHGSHHFPMIFPEVPLIFPMKSRQVFSELPPGISRKVLPSAAPNPWPWRRASGATAPGSFGSRPTTENARAVGELDGVTMKILVFQWKFQGWIGDFIGTY